MGGLVSFFGGRFFKKKGSRQGCMIELTFDNKRVELSAFCDSGNLLTDPISSKPCIVADLSAVKKVLPESILLFLRSGSVPESNAFATRIRAIPTCTVNGSGMLYAIRFDKVRISMGKGWREIDALVAITDIDNAADGAKALVPSVFAMGTP